MIGVIFYAIILENGGEMKNSESLGGDNLTPEEKTSILYDAMLINQPKLDDYIGEPGFLQGMIKQDKEKLKAKTAKMVSPRDNESSGDYYARGAEPIITFVLNREDYLQTRDSFAFLASEYDDKMNGTDVVFGVEKKNHSGYMIFAIDVATGTNPSSIQKKFDESIKHDWMSEIKYCEHDGKKWSDTDAPHFVVGMMPSTMDRALEKIRVGNGTIIREPDPTTDFLLASEIFEQIKMQIIDIEEHYSDETALAQVAKLKDLQLAIKAKLYKICGVRGETKEERAEDFAVKYSKNVKRMRGDLVYRNIMDEVRRQNDWNNGKKTMKSAGF